MNITDNYSRKVKSSYVVALFPQPRLRTPWSTDNKMQFDTVTKRRIRNLPILFSFFRRLSVNRHVFCFFIAHIYCNPQNNVNEVSLAIMDVDKGGDDCLYRDSAIGSSLECLLDSTFSDEQASGAMAAENEFLWSPPTISCNHS